MRKFLLCAALVLLVAVPVSATECSEQVMVGDFDIQFSGAVYDGFNTNFAYCVTGVDDGDFSALSHWVIGFDGACIDRETLVACGPEPCAIVINDPTTGVTGLKWDDTQVEKGETVCYDFTLAGDWTDMVGETTVAIKAGQETAEVDGICGPVCFGCAAVLNVLHGDELMVDARIIHNRAQSAETNVTFTITDAQRNVVAQWTETGITLEYGAAWEYQGAIPGVESLAPGGYTIQMGIEGMSGWKVRTKRFTID